MNPDDHCSEQDSSQYSCTPFNQDEDNFEIDGEQYAFGSN